jgi:hypothetical protein
MRWHEWTAVIAIATALYGLVIAALVVEYRGYCVSDFACTSNYTGEWPGVLKARAKKAEAER